MYNCPPLTLTACIPTSLFSVPCQVGDLPLHAVPVHVGVVGTPLCLQREARLLPGVLLRPPPGAPGSLGNALRPPPRAQLDVNFGEVVMQEAAQRSFHVFNTSFLDVRLEWAFWRLGPAGPVLRRWGAPASQLAAGLGVQLARLESQSLQPSLLPVLSFNRCLECLPAAFWCSWRGAGCQAGPAWLPLHIEVSAAQSCKGSIWQHVSHAHKSIP